MEVRSCKVLSIHHTLQGGERLAGLSPFFFSDRGTVRANCKTAMPTAAHLLAKKGGRPIHDSFLAKSVSRADTGKAGPSRMVPCIEGSLAP